MADKIVFEEPCIWYIYCDKFGRPNIKPGITGVRKHDTRVATYQTPFGLDNDIEFENFFVAERDEAEWLERKILSKYKHKRPDKRPGMTEWIKDITQEELIETVNNIANNNGCQIVWADSDLLPLKNNSDGIEKVKKRYLSEEAFEIWGKTGAIKR